MAAQPLLLVIVEIDSLERTQMSVRELRKVHILLGVALFAAGCQTTSTSDSKSATPFGGTACEDPSNVDAIAADDKCVGIKTYGDVSLGGALIVVLHGDVSSGGPAGYHYVTAQDAAALAPNAVGIGMLRPGYTDAEGRRSGGSNNGRRDHYTATNIDIVANGIRALQARHQPTRTIVVGHSGGAATVGVILGRHPDLIDAAILAACPCDVPYWRRSRGRSEWLRSLSPHRVVDEIRADVEIVLINGSRDNNTTSALAKRYADQLASAGQSAEIVNVQGAGHGWGGLRGAVRRQMAKLL